MVFNAVPGLQALHLPPPLGAAALLVLAACGLQALASARSAAALGLWAAAALAWLLGIAQALAGAAGVLPWAGVAAPVLAALAMSKAIALVLSPLPQQLPGARYGSVASCGPGPAAPWWVLAVALLAGAGALGLLQGRALLAAAALLACAWAAAWLWRAQALPVRPWLLALQACLAMGAAGLPWLEFQAGRVAYGLQQQLAAAWVLALTGLFMGLQQVSERRALLRAAGRDELTGLNRRRALLEHLHGLPVRGQPGLGVLMLDVDHFKSINDRYGHAAGDTVLARLGQLLRQCVRDEDLAARMGGEEFCVLLPQASLQATRQVAERLVAACRAQRVALASGERLAFTVSAGFAVGPLDALDEVFRQADAALYRAKNGGRDRACGPQAQAASPASLR